MSATQDVSIVTDYSGKSCQSESIPAQLDPNLGQVNSINAGYAFNGTIWKPLKLNAEDALIVTDSNTPAQTNVNIYTIDRLKNSSSSDAMNVNGSVTPVDFYFGPVTGTNCYITCLNIFLYDSGLMSIGKFGVLAGLTTGLKIIIKINGTEYLVSTMKTNEEVLGIFSKHPIVLSQVNLGFLNDQDFYSGVIYFEKPIFLNGTNGDRIIARVEDNLSSLDQLKIIQQSYRIL